jgi:FKBP-type peptidyl-prolyl cis-trans isomerase
MNKFKYYFILLITTATLFSCSKDQEVFVAVPAREFAVQYATEIKDIEQYLNTYYFTVTDSPGNPEDQNIVFTKIPAGGTQASIMSYKNSATFPKLLSREVKLHEINYTLYYLVLREGTGTSPSNVDQVSVIYRGDYLQSATVEGASTLTTTKFEEWIFQPQTLNLINTIRGWKEIFPQFKTGTASSNPDGTVSNSNFGAGAMFIPSGLAYYATGKGGIPGYAPLIFSFKLYAMQRLDHEFNIVTSAPSPDGILSYQEDIDGDGYIWLKEELNAGVINPDDTDGDGFPDFIDTDDDGDGVSTRTEITAANGVLIPFDAIPSCDGNTTDPNRKKRHLVKCN